MSDLSSGKYMIYDTYVSGHHLEYLHHIYMSIVEDGNQYVFVVPKTFDAVKSKLAWPQKSNVTFEYINEDDLAKIEGGYLVSHWRKARLAAKYIKRFSPDSVFCIELIVLLPFLPLFVSHRVKITGILYRLIPYEWKKLSYSKKIKDAIELIMLAKSRCIKTPLCLNDTSCACYYNKRLHTDKFDSIVDPVVMLKYEPKSIRGQFNVSAQEKIILHFGGLTGRKGSLMIMETIYGNQDLLNDKVFVFAGVVDSDIKKQFYEVFNRLKDTGRVFLFDTFCTYQFIADLCYSCDCILAPYKNVSYSSGLVGYASLYGKTIIGPGRGLIGKLIRKNSLGITLSELNKECLVDALSKKKAYIERSSDYAETNTVRAFSSKVMQVLDA